MLFPGTYSVTVASSGNFLKSFSLPFEPHATPGYRRLIDELSAGYRPADDEDSGGCWSTRQMTTADLNVVLRQAVRRLATGVAVLTVWHGDVVQGTTISSVVAISRDPLLIGVCLRGESSLTEVLGEARALCS